MKKGWWLNAENGWPRWKLNTSHCGRWKEDRRRKESTLTGKWLENRGGDYTEAVVERN